MIDRDFSQAISVFSLLWRQKARAYTAAAHSSALLFGPANSSHFSLLKQAHFLQLRQTLLSRTARTGLQAIVPVGELRFETRQAGSKQLGFDLPKTVEKSVL